MQANEIVTLPHFKPEEVEALKQEHERRKVMLKGRGMYSPDEERVRDAIQRELFWRAQPPSYHRDEELAHCLFTQGKIDEALVLAKDPERRAYYEIIRHAIVKDDNEFCACPESEEVTLPDGKKGVSQLWTTVGHFPSAKHGGAMMPIQKCAVCGFTNITSL